MNANSKPKAPKTVSDWLQSAAGRLRKVGISSARLDAEILLANTLHKDKSWLIAHSNEPVPAAEIKKVEINLKRREQNEPLAYIRGFREFYGRDFIVSPGVLIPRPESEALIEMAKSCPLQSGDTILDAGTGSGCLGITLKLELPDCSVTLLDISELALKIAKQNATKLEAEVSSVQKDVLNLQRTDELPHAPYKLIIANLPYVDSTWKRSPGTDFEPALALFSEAGGLWHYINFLASALHFLAKDGYVVIEADPRQHDELISYATELGFELAAYDGFALLLTRIPRPPEKFPKTKPFWSFQK